MKCQTHILYTYSFGGLIVPSRSFVELIDSFELEFRRLHGDELNYEQDRVIDSLRETIQGLFPNTPAKLIKTYVVGKSSLYSSK